MSEPAALLPPRQLADHHRAESEHADRAEQRHRVGGRGPVAHRLLAELPGGDDPEDEAEYRGQPGGGGQAAGVPQ
jgi:hypothetical protein